MSPAAMETLAVIVSREPVTRAEIERIRGVSAGRILASLLEKELIEEKGGSRYLGAPSCTARRRGFFSAPEYPTRKNCGRPGLGR